MSTKYLFFQLTTRLNEKLAISVVRQLDSVVRLTYDATRLNQTVLLRRVFRYDHLYDPTQQNRLAEMR